MSERSRYPGPRLAAAMLALTACSTTKALPSVTDMSASERAASPGDEVEVYAVVDLADDLELHELSGISFDPKTRMLYAIEDKAPEIVTLVASPDYRSWTAGSALPLSGYPADAWDGEGLVRLADGSFYVIANESEPVLAHFDVHGAFLRRMPVPLDYGKQVFNKGLESLTLSPDARFLFSANEAALVPDGPAASPSRGTLVRIWRRELGTSKDQEFAYRTEPLGAGRGGDMGVSELAALSGDGLLVLERGYQKGYGNTVRIFRTVLTGARDISGASSLDEGTPSLEKALVVDLAALHDPGMLLRGPQPNSLLENYEAMSIGPVLADGRRLLFLISDDNGRADQVTRILVLSLRLP